MSKRKAKLAFPKEVFIEMERARDYESENKSIYRLSKPRTSIPEYTDAGVRIYAKYQLVEVVEYTCEIKTTPKVLSK